MKTRPLYALAAIGGATLLALAAPHSTSGQNPTQGFVEPTPDLTSLVNDLTVQSRQLAENQALIDAKLDQISELVRQARIYAARGGKGGNLK